MSNTLLEHVEATALLPAPVIVIELAAIIRARHAQVQAILAYGSALRDSKPEDTLIDYYVLTATDAGVSTNPFSRMLCKLVPPNVYYVEANIGTITCRAKYAVLPMSLLSRKVQANISNPYFWVRFAQPVRLVWSVDEAAKSDVMSVVATAMTTAAANAKHLAPQAPFAQQWTALFQSTYATELRPEDPARARLIVDMQRNHFETVSTTAPTVSISTKAWSARRWQGKGLSLLRLAKAAFTFQGGADYAAWKIRRHSGVDITVKDWHRRHPFIASLVFLPKLLSKGALK